MDFKDRERGEEAKFAFDEENAFKIAARRNRLLGEWAAGLMNLSEEETDAYKKAVVQADFEEAGDEDVVRKLLGDLTAADCDVSEADIKLADAARANHPNAPCSSPALISSFIMTGTPPDLSRSAITKRPPGRRSVRYGVRLLRRSKSSSAPRKAGETAVESVSAAALPIARAANSS